VATAASGQCPSAGTRFHRHQLCPLSRTGSGGLTPRSPPAAGHQLCRCRRRQWHHLLLRPGQPGPGRESAYSVSRGTPVAPRRATAWPPSTGRRVSSLECPRRRHRLPGQSGSPAVAYDVVVPTADITFIDTTSSMAAPIITSFRHQLRRRRPQLHRVIGRQFRPTGSSPSAVSIRWPDLEPPLPGAPTGQAQPGRALTPWWAARGASYTTAPPGRLELFLCCFGDGRGQETGNSPSRGPDRPAAPTGLAAAPLSPSQVSLLGQRQ